MSLRSDLIAYMGVLGEKSSLTADELAESGEITGCLIRLTETLEHSPNQTRLWEAIRNREKTNQVKSFGDPELVRANKQCAVIIMEHLRSGQ